MTVREYLLLHNGGDIKSVGIYSAHPTQDAYGRYTDIIDPEVNDSNVSKYGNMEVDHVHLWVYDEPAIDMRGSRIMLRHIRACLYVK